LIVAVAVSPVIAEKEQAKMTRRWMIGVMLAVLAVGIVLPLSSQDKAKAIDVKSILEPIRAQYNIPALGGCVLVRGEIVGLGVTGVRKAGDPTPVTVDDQWHLGSCTKAFTATLIAKLIEKGLFRWDSTLAGLFPALAKSMHPKFRTVTLEQILRHRGGLPERTWPADMTLDDLRRLWGSLSDQRLTFVKKMLAEAPQNEPGTTYLYSNAGYVVAGAAAEAATGKAWEDLIRENIFVPLKMKSAGFGAMGTPGKIDEPWQHEWTKEAVTPIEPGPQSDNPLLIGPAGTIHCSLADWAAFVQMHLDGENGNAAFLKTATFRKLHTPSGGADAYALGWMAVERDWGGKNGKAIVLTHAGSNTRNWAVVWIAPQRDLAVLVTSNAGGNDLYAAIDQAAGALLMAALKL
jgi:CubicO group peptidase (beta-lactamase class C family)